MTPGDEVPSTLPHLLTAASAGGVGRVLLALHGGERRWLILLIETGLGALLGVIAASAATYFDPSLRDAGLGAVHRRRRRGALRRTGDPAAGSRRGGAAAENGTLGCGEGFLGSAEPGARRDLADR